MCLVMLGMINHKGLALKNRYRGKKATFSTLITTLFCSPRKVTGTSNQTGLETLLATMDAGLTELIILALAIAAQEKAPIPTPLLTLAHGSLHSEVSRIGCFPSGGFC